MKSLKFTLPVLMITCILCWGQLMRADISLAKGITANINPTDSQLAKEGTTSGSPQFTVDKTIKVPGVSDIYFGRQWSLAAMQLPVYSDLYLVNRRPVLVAVLDTGIDNQQEDLQGKVLAEANFSNSPSVNDLNGHGTHIAGIIAAKTNNALGIAGIDPFCQILNVKVADDLGRVYTEAVVQGIVWAADNRANIINLSIEISKSSPDLEDAVNYAWKKGAVVVAAASNHTVEPVYPAYYSNCIAVAAINQQGELGPLAYNADWVHLAAPGYSIFSTLPDNQYGYESGTSFAAAHVSGLAALLFGLAKDNNGDGKINDEVRDAIESGASSIQGSVIKLIDAAPSLALINSIQ